VSEPKTTKQRVEDATATVLLNLRVMGIVSTLQMDKPHRAQEQMDDTSSEDLEYLQNLYTEAARMCARTVAKREQVAPRDH